jgi:hypothetical protein
MQTFRKLPKASPRTKIADAMTGSTWSLTISHWTHTLVGVSVPEERKYFLILVGL